MVDVREFLATVYFGDRYCRRIIVDSDNCRVSFEFDSLSRIRDPSGRWNYYAAEDVPGGVLVFDDVAHVSFSREVVLPIDTFRVLKVTKDVSAGQTRWTVLLALSAWVSVDLSAEIVVAVTAGGSHIEDPAQPGKQITD